jgi:hypothetical protein
MPVYRNSQRNDSTVTHGPGWGGLEVRDRACRKRLLPANQRTERRDNPDETNETTPASISRGNTLTQGEHAQEPGMANQIEAARGPGETFWGWARGVNGQTKL